MKVASKDLVKYSEILQITSREQHKFYAKLEFVFQFSGGFNPTFNI